MPASHKKKKRKYIIRERCQHHFGSNLPRRSKLGKLPGNMMLQCVVGRGEWLHKKTYANLHRACSSGFCRRCIGTSSLHEKHWLDAENLGSNDAYAASEHLQSNIPLYLPLRKISGCHADMEQSDTLHSIWLGSAEDAAAPILFEIIQTSLSVPAGRTESMLFALSSTTSALGMTWISVQSTKCAGQTVCAKLARTILWALQASVYRIRALWVPNHTDRSSCAAKTVSREELRSLQEIFFERKGSSLTAMRHLTMAMVQG